MKKFIYAFLSVFLITPTYASESNPFFDGYTQQVSLNLGYGVNSGFLLPPPTQWVPFLMMQIQYSQPATFFGLPARKSLNIIQTLGHGKKYGWHWDKYTIPIAMLSQDVILAAGCDWYFYTGLAVGMQAQQNERIGSKLLFGFKLGAGYKLSDRVSAELFVQHFSNGNTDHFPFDDPQRAGLPATAGCCRLRMDAADADAWHSGDS